MSRKAILLLLPFLALGCAGEGVFTGPPKFFGTFGGPWESTTSGNTGTINFTISNDATVIGSYSDDNTGKTGTLTGRVTEHSQIYGKISFTDSTKGTFNIALTSTSTKLGGDGVVDEGGGSQTIDFVFTITQ